MQARLCGLLFAAWILVVAPLSVSHAGESALAVAALTEDLAEDLAPRLLDDEFYTEGWDYYFYFEGGFWATVQLIVSNFGPGDHRGLVIAKILDPSGESVVIKNGRSREEWKFVPSPFEVRLARHRWSGEYPNYRIDMINSTGELQLDVVSHAGPVRLPVTEIDPQRYHFASLMKPVVSVSGRYRPRDKSRSEPFPWRDLRGGRGFAVRYVNNGALETVAHTWLRFAPLEATPGPLVYALGQKDHSQEENERAEESERDKTLAWVAIPDNETDGWRLAELAAPIIKMPADEDRLPDPITLVAQTKDAQISGKIVPRRLLDRFDFLDELKKVERAFLQFLKTPLQYRYLVDYEFTYVLDGKTHQWSGTGVVELMRVH